jgi:hypothetical protein
MLVFACAFSLALPAGLITAIDCFITSNRPGSVEPARDQVHARCALEGVMKLLRVQPDILVNIDNIAYIELTGKGGADIYFVGMAKPLRLNTTEAEGLRDYISGEQVSDVTKAA